MHHPDLWPKVIHVLQAQGFSQRDLAEKAGVDQSTICRIATGRAEPRFSAGSALIALAGGAKHLADKHGIEIPAATGEHLHDPDTQHAEVADAAR